MPGCAAGLVQRRGSDLLPRTAAPGKPEIYLRAEPAAAKLALRLGNALAEAGAVVHLADGPLPGTLTHVYVVALGSTR